MRRLYYLLLPLLFVLSCQHSDDYISNRFATINESSFSKTNNQQEQANNEDANNTELAKLIAEEVVSYYDFYSDSNSDPVFTEKDINNRVYKWIIYFTQKNRAWFSRALARSYKYEDRMKKILMQQGVPTDLFYLALIESGFTERAHSKAGAKGIWQFMKGTAKMYGLKVSRWRDERHSPYKATAAAAAYLRDLHNIYGSWHLAIASYNAGEFRIRRAILKNGNRNFWNLVDRGALPRETANYVPKFIAAAIIAKSPEKFAFNTNNSVPKTRYADNSDYYKVLNKLGSYKRRNVPSRGRVSRSRRSRSYYTVRRGDNLWNIAKRNRTTITSLKLCNKIKGTSIRPGQRLKLKCTRRSRRRVIVRGRNKMYIVKRGDTLWGISKKFKTSIPKIKKCNPSVGRKSIYPGQKLRVSCASLG